MTRPLDAHITSNRPCLDRACKHGEEIIAEARNIELGSINGR